MGDNFKALSYFEQALSVTKGIYGNIPHPEIALTLGSLGKTYEKQNDRENALESYKKAYETYKVIYGDDHADTIEALCSLQSYLTSL